MPIDSIPDYPHIPMAIPHHHFACLNLPESCTFAASWSDNFSRGTLANNQNTVFWCHQTSPKKWGFHLVGTKCAWLKVVAICYIVIYIYICVWLCVWTKSMGKPGMQFPPNAVAFCHPRQPYKPVNTPHKQCVRRDN